MPDFEQLHQYVSQKYEQHHDSLESMLKDKQIIDRGRAEMNRLLHPREGFKPFEKLQNIHFLDKYEFKMVEELTNTLKKKRHAIEAKYHEIIGKLLK